MNVPLVAPSSLAPNGSVTVGVGELAVIDQPGTIITHALGSCIGVVAADLDAGVAGLLHYMLPSSTTNPDKAEARPSMFGDTGIPLLFQSLYELGARKERMIVCAAGGAQTISTDDPFRIGPRNRTILRKLFWKNGVLLSADETGGDISRTLLIRMPEGRVCMRHKGTERQLWPELHTQPTRERVAS